MTDTRFTRDADFDAKELAWYKAVAKVFARVQKKDIADVPADVWKKLIRTTYDGIDINPLYNRVDEGPETAIPGTFPYTRGGHQGLWGVTESFDADSTNEEVHHALNFGTTNLVIHGDADLPTLLKGVLAAYAPIRLEAGKATATQALKLYEWLGDVTPAYLELGAAPLTAAIDGQESIDLGETTDLAVAAHQRDNVRAILVDGVSLSNQGASDGQEIGFALAAGLEYVRALTEAGLSFAEALGQISFRLAISDDQFAQIAKLRAFRTLWARVADILGEPLAGDAPVHALTAPVMFSQRDPYVNMLRATVATFAAGVGGATDVEVLPFDSAIVGGLGNTSKAFKHRIARNTNLLLLEESHLGHVIDPAGGSYYVEKLTAELAAKAWGHFQEVEAQGGFIDATKSGFIRTQLDDMHEKVRNDIAHRRKQVTAVNEFPNLSEAPLPAVQRVEPAGVKRWAAEFEALRNRSDAYVEEHGTRPAITLIPLGPLAKHNVRTGFATNLLASGGIAAVNPGQLVPGTPEFSEAAAGMHIAVICGTDAEYDASGAAALQALKVVGVSEVYLAGSPGHDFEPDGYLNLKINAAATLAQLLEKLGA
ncbi:MAG: methylmalonyl-CoA mutase family protein [Corynebacterium sp.]|nr:methylmalonyl-CoA mutase family protein [Corynebacterium sp.]